MALTETKKQLSDKKESLRKVQCEYLCDGELFLFHKWVTIDNEVKGLIESETGYMHLMDHNEIRFI